MVKCPMCEKGKTIQRPENLVMVVNTSWGPMHIHSVGNVCARCGGTGFVDEPQVPA